MTAELVQLAWLELATRHPDDPYAWMMAHRVLQGQPMRHIPALGDIARDPHPFIVIQKSAQVGVTELLVNLSLWAADMGFAGRGHALFLMPTADQMRDVAQARFDRAIQESPYLRSRLQPEPPRRKGADNTRVKRMGDGYVYLRGSESARQVASVDADLVVLDEYDQMASGVLELAQRRLASSQAARLIVASTPRYPETGVHELFLHSDQHRYLLPCGSCGLEQALNFEDHVDRERLAIVCVDCREPLDVLAPGRWVSDAPGNAVRGYHLSRLYSPWLDLGQLVQASEATSVVGIQQFQNSDLGQVFSPPGGGLSLAELDAARGHYRFDDYAGEPCVMGVDVGVKFHVVVRELPGDVTRGRIPAGAPRRLWWVAEVDTIAEVEALLERFRVRRCVIDAQPEIHLTRQFALKYPRRVWLASYDRQLTSHERERGRRGEPNRQHVNRVEALDLTLGMIRGGAAPLPLNARELGGRITHGVGEYYRQLLAPQRTLEPDAQGNYVARYLDYGKPDHFAHADVYCALAGAPDPKPPQVRAWSSSVGRGSGRRRR